MSIYVDTSAFLAVLNANDETHEKAKQVWIDLIESLEAIVCNSYVLVETYALLQNRLGMEATRVFHEDIFPMLQLEWIDGTLHHEAVTAFITANRRNLSLVDCASFVTMRRMGITKAFTFDKHYSEQGFHVFPALSE